MSPMFLTATLVLLAAPGLKIDHQPLDCMVKDRFPQVEAGIEPSDQVVKARLYFKSGKDPDFYFVDMALRRGRFMTKLPKPKEKAGTVIYFIEAVAADGAVFRTPEMGADVVADEKRCPKGGRLAARGPDGEVRIYSTITSKAKPKGFDDIASVQERPAERPSRGRADETKTAARAPQAQPERSAGEKRSVGETGPAKKDEGKKDEGKKDEGKKEPPGKERAGKERADRKDGERKAAEAPKDAQKSQAAPPAPVPTPPPAPAQAPPLAVGSTPLPQAEPTTQEQDYPIGPDDILRIVVYGYDDLTQTVVVQPDGNFTYPLIGRVKAAEQSPRQLAQQLADLLANGFVRNPQVSVTFQEVHSQMVYVMGEVTKPGPYPLAGSRTLVEILSKAGPMTPNAGAEAVVVRPRSELQGPVPVQGLDADPAVPSKQADVIRINLLELQSGNLEKNILLKRNDTIFVPPAAKVYVSGEVRNPGAFPLTPGTTVRQAISLAGGFTDRASAGRLRVVRTVRGVITELKIKIDDPVQPGDTILVKEKLF